MSAGRAAEVVVVGAGAIGACAARELALRGAEVAVLEREHRGALAGTCSAGSAGLLCPSHAQPLANPAALRQGARWLLDSRSPFYARPRPAVLPWLVRFATASTRSRAQAGERVIRELALASLALHAELAEAGLDTGFTRGGLLNVFETERGLEQGRRAAEEAVRAGLRAEPLDAGALRRLEPAVSAAVAGGVYYPDDAHCDPLRFLAALRDAAAEAGARIRTGVEALGLLRRQGRVRGLITSAGELPAGQVVLAAGAWSARLARDAGLHAPIEGGKGYHVDLAAGEGDPRTPLWLHETRVIATPLAGRLRLAGTLELTGLDLRVNRRRVNAIVRTGRRVLPALAARPALELWRGIRPCTPDGLPLIGRAEGEERLVLASGHGMLGLMLAPITGRLVAELVAGADPSHDLTPLRPERFRPLLPRLRAG